MIITKHAKKRAKERLGLNKKAITRLAGIAQDKGKRHKDFTGQARKYLDSVYLSQRKGNNMRVYGEYVFLFQNDTLVTVFAFPKNLRNRL